MLYGVAYVSASNNNESVTMMIQSLDVPLTSPITSQSPVPGWLGTPTAMPVPTAPLNNTNIIGMAFNFWNNVWDTNYIFWYPYLQGVGDENMLFRFVVTTTNQ